MTLAAELCVIIRSTEFDSSKDDDFLFRTSLCWACSNYYVEYPDDERATWVGMDDRELETLVTRLMPIPADEVERFKKAVPQESEAK
jgi:hypothetical protein